MNQIGQAAHSNRNQTETKEQSGDAFAISPPAISLPKGGGAMRGIDEKFQVNPATGSGAMSVPIAASPGRQGFGPQLALNYDSGAGNGPFGLGWTLTLPTISRKTDKGLPRYEDATESDTFILTGAEDLVPTLVETASGWQMERLPHRLVDGHTYAITRYRPRTEGLFARIERWTNQADQADTFWRSISKENITTWYGKTSETRIVDPADPQRIFSWLICESYDDKGQAIVYEYTAENSAGADRSQVHERNRTDTSRSANRYLKRVKYGNQPSRLVEPDLARLEWLFELVFDYGEGHYEVLPDDTEGRQFAQVTNNGTRAWPVRQDAFSRYRAGFEVRTYRLCRRVLMFHHFPTELGMADYVVRSTEFDYDEGPILTYLNSVTHAAYLHDRDNIFRHENLPPVEFEYSRVPLQDGLQLVDVVDAQPEDDLPAPLRVQEVDSTSLENLPVGLDGSQYRLVDLDGEGLSGILTEQSQAWFYKPNLGQGRFGPMLPVAQKPSLAAINGGQQLLDLAGDGQLDLALFDGPTPGFYERSLDAGWHQFRSFASLPNLRWDDPNLRFVDLTGDGHADILITEEQVFAWYPSLAEAGFAQAERVFQPWDEEQGPRLIFADSSQSVYLADLSGDGLIDLARIRNGEVCYWPNLGYGRFGAKVTMDNAPHFDTPDLFDQRRLRLADIDGSGIADILYLGHDGVDLYFNQAGNAWSEAARLGITPRYDNLASVQVTDLLGTGTACLVWSSPLPSNGGRPLRYIDLMNGVKPHLLIRSRNNLGAETEVQYAPSTKFYLADKAAGTPWITKLPFPVYVIEKQIVTDKWRKTRFATTYSYHHGYFDGIEREFRGFGRVEQIDSETYGEFATGNVASPYITDDHTLYQPPIKTITWYHTGAFLNRERILSHYEAEYFPHWFERLIPDETNVLGTFRENALPEPDIKSDELTADEWRQALRACKGMILRQEIYELAVDALVQGEEVPVKLFSTAYHNCHIRMVQPQASNRHAIFLATESEAITYHYELDLQLETLTPDPRIAHTLNLRVDEYGNVLQSVAVVYPRLGRHEDTALPPATTALIDEVQRERHLVYTETRYTNDVDYSDDYRLRLPCEVLTYEVTGEAPAGTYFTLAELRRLRLSHLYQAEGISVIDIPYHQTPDLGEWQKRIVEQVRMLFFDEELGRSLPLGTLNALGLPYETYKLALTEPLLTAILGPKLADLQSSGEGYTDMLNRVLSEGGYHAWDGDWWIRSGMAGFAHDAAAHFYLPERYTDPFGQVTTLQYDAHNLYIESSTDPLANRITVRGFNFRVLAPTLMEDMNGNLSEVAFDLLGLPTAMALRGKGSEGDTLAAFDDTLPTFDDDLLNPPLETRIRFFEADFDGAEARRLLDGATARHIYDFGQERQADGSLSYGHRPAAAAAILREQHGAMLEPGQESPLQVAYEYSDGGGNVLVKKAQAEPETSGGRLRWLASGKTILNNKGKAVKQYEPYFSVDNLGQPNHRFEEPREVGVTPIIYYDAVGRTVRTELPDGSYSRVEFSPWHVTSYDPNDTVLEEDNGWYARMSGAGASPAEQRAARIAAKHAHTPATVFLDSLGREVISLAHNRVPADDPTVRNVPLLDRDWHDETYLTFSKLDAEGKPLWIRDARGNLVMQYISPPDPTGDFVPCYDIAGNLLSQHSMDAGGRWLLMDSTGQPFYAWDENEVDGGTILQTRIYHTRYDELRRPLEQQLSIDGGVSWQVVGRFKYRDPATGSPTPDADAATLNLGGQVYQHYDPSGLMTNEGFDLKGNLLAATRRLASEYDAPVIHWPEAPPDSLFEPEIFSQNSEYDALSRMERQENWHLAGRDPATYTPTYNKRGLLLSEELSVQGVPRNAIRRIEYNAKGQRTLLEAGNGSLTRYDYDPQTFRLRQLRTTRNDFDPPFPDFHSHNGGANGNVLQQLNYTYDPSGNITEIYDEAYEPVFFRNQRVEPRGRYSYDALYRLIEAEGREQVGASGAPPQRPAAAPKVTFPISASSDPNALRNYRQRYIYDSVGNIMQMRHNANGGSWTRDYEYAGDSNRLNRTRTNNPTETVDYRYDLHGSMLNLNRIPDEYLLRWDYRDMIHRVNLGGGGQAYYNYDSSKQRSRKRIERIGSTVEERFYLGGMELYRRWVGSRLIEEIETHHLFADDQRVLIVEDVRQTDNTDLGTGILYRYQYGNHLGSVGLELNEEAQPISYEEYHPYGTTAYQAKNAMIRATAKRYRYTGMERDEETGLSYHTARYYAPWLGRWCSVDPQFLVDGNNLYRFSRNNPLNLIDTSGTQSSPEQQDINSLPDSEYRAVQVEAARQEGRTLSRFQEILRRIEIMHPRASEEQIVDALMRVAGYTGTLWNQLIERTNVLDLGSELNREIEGETLTTADYNLLRNMLQHQFNDSGIEMGTVVDDQGNLIALGHVIAGISAGYHRNRDIDLHWTGYAENLDNLYAVTIAGDIGQSLANRELNNWGRPALGRNSEATMAELRGDAYGFALGSEVSSGLHRTSSLSETLNNFFELSPNRRRSRIRDAFAREGGLDELRDQVVKFYFNYINGERRGARLILGHDMYRSASSASRRFLRYFYINPSSI